MGVDWGSKEQRQWNRLGVFKCAAKTNGNSGRGYFGGFVAHCSGWDFGGKEDVRARERVGGGANCVTAGLFVSVGTSGIDMAVAGLEGIEDY